MRSSGSSNHEHRYRQPGSVENEENGMPGFLEAQFRRSTRDAEKKKLEGSYIQLGGKDKQVKSKSVTLKSLLLSLLFLTAFLTVTFPIASFESERELLITAQNASSSRVRKVALMWERIHAKETAKTENINGKSGSYQSSEKKTPPQWPDYLAQITSLLSPLKDELGGQLKIGLLNFDEDELNQQHLWRSLTGGVSPDAFLVDHASKDLKWKDLFPEWIDEEELYEQPECPSLPMPKVKSGTRLDLVVVKVPCRNSADWSRDVVRLHAHLAAATVAADTSSSHVLLYSACAPIPNLFTCRELVARKDSLWLYKVDLPKLKQKLDLPVGSCELAVPLKTNSPRPIRNANSKREAYATVLHSAELYVCGAIALAQSIRMTGSTRDLIILVDENISAENRQGLEAAGWMVREIQRIRNPRADPESYNEWNYSKFRLWQLTSYEKIIFIDSDILVLRNIDFLFELPEITASGNSRTVFNSGLMVIEPCNCTFELLMGNIQEIVSYNGGDQGYLNEIFTWWHRLPRHMNYLKHFWSSEKAELEEKTKLFGEEPAEIYVLHYLGLKPWLCFRDYDCNWNVDDQRSFASDEAHQRWWRLHDRMASHLRAFCELPTNQTLALDWDLAQARAAAFPDHHWERNITDPRFIRHLHRRL